VIVDEPQTRDGYTEALFITPEGANKGVMVQLGFEQPTRLLWISVEPASAALPDELLGGATQV
jgi:hypothetical protein